MNETSRRATILRGVAAVWTIAALAAAVGVLGNRWPEARAAAEALSWPRVGASLALALLGVGVSGLIWHALLRGLAGPVPPPASARIFFVGQLGKYLPGSVWPLLAQARMGAAAGIAPRVAATAGTLFLWVHLVTAGAVAAATLGGVGFVPRWSPWLAPVALALLHPRLIAVVTGRVLALLRREPLPVAPGGATLARAVAAALLMWACYGLHLALLLPTGGPGAVRGAGLFAAGWAAGFVVVFVPAGAGVREAVLTAGLTPFTSLAGALAIVLVSRFALTAADVLWGAPLAVAAGVAPRRSARRSTRRSARRGRRRLPSRRLASLWPLGVFAVAVAVLLGPALVGVRLVLPHDLLLSTPPWSLLDGAASPANPELRDLIDTYYPVQRHLFEGLRAGVRTDWVPDLLLGVPGLPFIGWGVFSVFNLPALALPFDLAWNWAMALRLLAAMTGGYALARQFGAGRTGGTVAGLSFGLSGYMVGWLGWPQSHVGALAPWVLVAVRCTIAAPLRWWAPPALALSTAALWLAGFPSVAVYVLVAAGVIALCDTLALARRSRASAAVALAAAAGATVVGTALAAFSLLPSETIASDLDLGYRETMWMANVPLRGLLTFAVPKLFGDVVHQTPWLGAAYVETVGYAGLLTLLLALLVLVLTPRPPGALLLAGLIAAYTAIAYGLPPVPRLLSALPIVSEHPPPRVLALVGLFLAVLGGLGADALADVVRGRRRVRQGLALAVVAGGVLLAPLIAWQLRRVGAPVPEAARFTVIQLATAVVLLAAAAVLVTLAARRLRRGGSPVALMSVLVFVVGLDMLLFASGWNVQVPRRDLFPSAPGVERLLDVPDEHRVAGADGAGLPNTHLLYGYRDLRAHGFVTARQREALSRAGARWHSPTNWDLTASNTGLWQPWLSLMGVRGVLTGAQVEHLALVVAQPHDGVVLGPLTADITLTSTVHARRDGAISAVGLPVGTYARSNAGELLVTVVADAERREARVPVADIADNSWVALPFEPLAVAAGEPVSVTITATADDREQAVAVFGNARGGTPQPAFALAYTEDRSLAVQPLADHPNLVWIDNPSAWPHVTVVTDFTVVAAAEAVEEAQRLPVDGTRRAVVEAPAGLAAAAGGDAELVDWERAPGRIRAAVLSSQGAVVVALEQPASGWSATVDGEPAPLLTANALFLAAHVPPGTHEVVFAYATPALGAGRALSLAALLVVLAWSVAGAVSARRRVSGASAPT